jgi:predicted transcriptional regulator of viral defense system
MYSINKRKNIKMANIKQNRFLMIAKTKEQIFHLNDLARIWGIANRQNLAMTLNRYVAAGLIYRIYRGLYSLKPAAELDPLILGAKALNNYCYLSGETILAKQGVIFQQVNYFTFIGSSTKRFKIGTYKYYCRQLKGDFLYNDTGVLKTGKAFNEATLERAAADILYFNPRYHFDNPMAINQAKLKDIQNAVYNK